jgi:hypothetical protein
MADEPKSKSGPLASGQLVLTGDPQSIVNASLAVIWRDHSSFPVSMSKARKASEVEAAGSE